MDPLDLGRRLAERHDSYAAPEPDPDRSLVNYAETARVGDWTLRSALVRLAQPEPRRVAALLELMRRLDAALHHVARLLERHTVLGDRGLTAAGVEGPPVDPWPDARAADLARLVAAGVDERDLLAGYEERAPLDDQERLAVPVLAVAVRLESLADRLTAWALAGPEDPPVGEVDEVIGEIAARLDELGVPVETGPPPGVRAGRR